MTVDAGGALGKPSTTAQSRGLVVCQSVRSIQALQQQRVHPAWEKRQKETGYSLEKVERGGGGKGVVSERASERERERERERECLFGFSNRAICPFSWVGQSNITLCKYIVHIFNHLQLRERERRSETEGEGHEEREINLTRKGWVEAVRGEKWGRGRRWWRWLACLGWLLSPWGVGVLRAERCASDQQGKVKGHGMNGVNTRSSGQERERATREGKGERLLAWRGWRWGCYSRPSRWGCAEQAEWRSPVGTQGEDNKNKHHTKKRQIRSSSLSLSLSLSLSHSLTLSPLSLSLSLSLFLSILHPLLCSQGHSCWNMLCVSVPAHHD